MPEDPNKNSSKHEDNSTNLDEKNKRVLELIEDITCNAAQVQKRVLNEILSQNAEVEYLQRHGFSYHDHDHDHLHQEFKKTIPVVNYEDLKPDIDRIANGDNSPILCSHPISEFLTSSGTSGGERKLMPTIEEELERKSFLYSLLMPVMDKFIPNLDKGKGMYFLFIKSESRTPGGLLARPVLTSYYKSSHFLNNGKNPNSYYTSPKETILCPDSYQSMYSQLLCGLSQRDQVLRVGAVFASGFIRAIRFLQNHWPILCKDIRTGTIDEQIITDHSVKNAVMKILKTPNPKLADFIEEECKKESWKGIIQRLWPKAKYIDVIVTGTMSQYIPTLNYYGNEDDIPLVSSMYASSECYFGINLNPISKPSEVKYTLIPTMAYFEFIPLFSSSSSSNDDEEHQELVDLVDVEIGQEYELVITTYAVGDILRVSGFKNNAPQFTFVCRKNVALSIDSEKTYEVELHNAVTEAAKHLIPFDSILVEYTSCVDTSTIPGHYVLYWEISSSKTTTKVMNNNIDIRPPSPPPATIFEDCCLIIEESLNSVYRQCRVSDKSIGPLEIKLVENGTFDKLMDFAISNGGASINQYKAPRCVHYAPILELLNSRVVSSFYSPKCPKW